MSILEDRIRPLDPRSLQELLEPGGDDRTAREAGERQRDERDQLLRTPSRLGLPSAPVPDVPAPVRSQAPLETTSFRLASRGGYVRLVTGTIAYLDEDAETYMVQGSDGGLHRVPLRDITTMRTETTERHRPKAERDAEGLGTGDVIAARS